MKKFEFLEHTADIKFKVYGKNINQVFEHCTLAFSTYISRERKIKSKIKKEITIEADNHEQLLYKFLDELIYLLDADKFIVSKAKIQINDNKLSAILEGDSTLNYKDLDHVKAATYAEMYIKPNLSGWEAQVVLDV